MEEAGMLWALRLPTVYLEWSLVPYSHILSTSVCNPLALDFDWNPLEWVGRSLARIHPKLRMPSWCLWFMAALAHLPDVPTSVFEKL